ncbi:MAG: hypothetical protein IPK50_10710 [Fibrobacterota bacterium]|nr:hypothetical protein [Fibrobacterota bacterium]QQS07347.1 MAG: hypothetical protein IPK50_10710 [Fibrobacterota bacterium]
MKLTSILSLAACAVAVSLVSTQSAQAVAIDATTGSSIHVTGGSTKQDSVTISWTESERNSTLKLFIDSTAPATTSSKIAITVPVRGTQTWKITRAFTPGVKYNFKFQGYYPNATTLVSKYTTTGTFTMEKTAGLVIRIDPPKAPQAAGWDAAGRTVRPGAMGAGLTSSGATIPTR